MSDQHELGKKGEEWAKSYLEQKNHDILSKNYSFQKAEIDLISKVDNRIVFTEVKTRYGDSLESIQQAVSKKKQKQIIKAAHHYIQEHDVQEEARFDIVWILVQPQNKVIEHIEEAFYPTI